MTFHIRGIPPVSGSVMFGVLYDRRISISDIFAYLMMAWNGTGFCCQRFLGSLYACTPDRPSDLQKAAQPHLSHSSASIGSSHSRRSRLCSASELQIPAAHRDLLDCAETLFSGA